MAEVQVQNSMKTFIFSLWQLKINILFFIPSFSPFFLKYCYCRSWEKQTNKQKVWHFLWLAGWPKRPASTSAGSWLRLSGGRGTSFPVWGTWGRRLFVSGSQIYWDGGDSYSWWDCWQGSSNCLKNFIIFLCDLLSIILNKRKTVSEKMCLMFYSKYNPCSPWFLPETKTW